MEPQFRFCTGTDGTRIAYASYGSGPPVLYVMTPVLSIEAQFRVPEARSYFDALAARLRLIMLDRRGDGASARDVADISPEAEARDIAAVAAAASLDSFTLFSDIATSACATYARHEPERVRNMIVYGGAVNIASRICGLCAPGEIQVSATVRTPARTSAGVTFEDRGEQELKGINDPLRVFAVRTGAV